jgi:hypothetical protein
MPTQAGDAYVSPYDLSALRVIATAGEPIGETQWLWLRDTVGGGKAEVLDSWWQTETGAAMMSQRPSAVGTPLVPVIAGVCPTEIDLLHPAPLFSICTCALTSLCRLMFACRLFCACLSSPGRPLYGIKPVIMDDGAQIVEDGGDLAGANGNRSKGTAHKVLGVYM